MRITYQKLSELSNWASTVFCILAIFSLLCPNPAVSQVLSLIAGGFATASLGFIFVQGKRQLGDVFGLGCIVLGTVVQKAVPCIMLCILGSLFITLQIIEWNANSKSKSEK